MRKSILIVDDEPKVLEAFHRLLNELGEVWYAEFAPSGGKALQILSMRPFDVVLADLNMPDMDGIQLLTEVNHRWPQTTRIILCWETERQSLARVFGTAHQYLFKPCNPKALRDALAGVFSRSGMIVDPKLQRLVSQLKTVPSLPALYVELMKEMRAESASLQKAGEIIARDPGMTAKILQLANSAYLGYTRQVSCPEEAILYLGVETIKALVLSLQIFTYFDRARIKAFNLVQLWKHSCGTGGLAKRICLAENQDSRIVEQAFTGGVLHDIGKLVLAANLPDQYQEACSLALIRNLTITEAEQEVFGASHADVGGFLLNLWGLPDAVVESVALHHRPDRSHHLHFTPTTAVHAADALESEKQTSCQNLPESPINLDYIASLGLMDRFAAWQELAWNEEGAAAANAGEVVAPMVTT
jgi:HD-like signal output (HDOD) protein/ActR/RegA family two-component response regulator